jgi:hypothetical protein
MAVGYYYSGHDRTLAELWNGTSWSVVPSPSPGDSLNITAVSCASATACMAVGAFAPRAGGPNSALAESWNGTSWSVVHAPSPGTDDNLVGVSCATATACTAVGSYGAGRAGVHTLIESWDGASWSLARSPNPSHDGDYLYSVSCTSATACTAVGAYANLRTLAEDWDGTSWSVVPSTSPGSDSYLGSVSCVSATACTAVGSRGLAVTRTLVESWNGTSWSRVTSPSRSPYWDPLTGVSCVSATACTAAGARENAGQHVKTLIETSTAAANR